MKKQESYKYNIFCKDSLIHENLTEEEFYDKCEELAQEFFDTGVPHPTDIRHEMIKE